MKTVKQIASIFTPVVLAGLSAQGAFPIGDSVQVFVTGEAGTRYESNVLLVDDSREAKSDMLCYFTPGVIINAGKAGATDFSAQAIYRYKVYAYSDLHDLDTQNNDFTSNFVYDGASISLNGAFSVLEAQTNTDLSGADTADLLEPGRVERTVYNGSLYGEYLVSPKTKIGTGVTYSLQDYATLGYQDFSSISIPLDCYYSMTPKMALSLGYQYRMVYIGSSSDLDAIDQTISVGVRGDILPKLKGYFRVGFTNRNYRGDYSNVDDDTGISFSGKLTYDVSPLFTVGTRLSRDYSVAPSSGHTTQRTGASLIGSYKMTDTISFGGNLSYYFTDYVNDGREDGYVATGVSASYQPNEYFNFLVAYDFNINDSTRSTGDYSNNILRAAATFRF